MDFLLLSALMVTMLVGGPVGAAIIVHRNGSWAALLRRHMRSLLLLVAVGWAVVAVINFWDASWRSWVSAWLGLVLCGLNLFLAFFARPQSKQAP